MRSFWKETKGKPKSNVETGRVGFNRKPFSENRQNQAVSWKDAVEPCCFPLHPTTTQRENGVFPPMSHCTPEFGSVLATLAIGTSAGHVGRSMAHIHHSLMAWHVLKASPVRSPCAGNMYGRNSMRSVAQKHRSKETRRPSLGYGVSKGKPYLQWFPLGFRLKWHWPCVRTVCLPDPPSQ